MTAGAKARCSQQGSVQKGKANTWLDVLYERTIFSKDSIKYNANVSKILSIPVKYTLFT